jgi:hypothetical protein
MSRGGILALYSPFTGEVNINLQIPDYMIPFTAAHEWAHSLGIASEAEANFYAFLSCAKSKNDYIRYSGTVCALEYILTDLSASNKKTYLNIWESVPESVKDCINAYKAYAKKYQSYALYSITDGANSAHHDMWDKNGKASYSATSALLVDYICSPICNL